jgi:hypothetical protein
MKNPEHAKVFISSILNRSVENLIEERNAERKAIDSYPFLRPWAFEIAPASIEELDESYLRHASIASKEPEDQLVCGTLGEVGQRRMSVEADPGWRIFAAASVAAIY